VTSTSAPAVPPSLEQLLSEWDLLVEVRSFRLDVSDGRPWTDAFKEALDDWCVALDDAGVVSMKSWERDERGTIIDRDEFKLEPLGTYLFIGPGAIALPPGLPALECPFLLAPYGYVAVKVDWMATEDSVDQLITGLVKESMGRLLATERDWKHTRARGADGQSSAPHSLQVIDVPCTAKKRFSLLLGKFSIEDGDVLLSREDPAYIRYVIDEVKKALTREGYTGELGTTSTCHNPFRYWQEQDGRFYIFGPHGLRPSQRELEAFLGRHEFEIWVFDFDRVRRLVDSVEVSVMWS
jgi:hypothetical protein